MMMCLIVCLASLQVDQGLIYLNAFFLVLCPRGLDYIVLLCVEIYLIL